MKFNPIEEFRNDHRKVRDGLLDLIELIEKKEVKKAGEKLSELDRLVGPHFRYEEETLYPTLRRFLGNYVDELISEHDEVIATARKCAEILSKGEISDEEAKEASLSARKLLVHVSNCDGLAILTERLNESELKNLADKFIKAREENVSLLEWAEKIRKR